MKLKEVVARRNGTNGSSLKSIRNICREGEGPSRIIKMTLLKVSRGRLKLGRKEGRKKRKEVSRRY